MIKKKFDHDQKNIFITNFFDHDLNYYFDQQIKNICLIKKCDQNNKISKVIEMIKVIKINLMIELIKKCEQNYLIFNFQSD